MGCYTHVVVPEYHVLKAANTALSEHFTEADLHIYQLMSSLFYETNNTGEGQNVAQSRYSAMVSHPLHAYFGHSIKNLSYDLGYTEFVGESDKKSDILAYISRTSWNPEVAKYITHIHWG